MIANNLKLTDIIFVITNSNILLTDIASFSIAIQPGQILEIDSEFFTVTLDGNNVFDSYSGDWVKLSRETVDIILSTGNNGILEGKILYKELYL